MVLLKMALQHRTIHTLISKTGKEIERHFVSDLNCLTKVDKNFDTDPKLHNRVNALIVDHLISTGKFDVAETLLKVHFNCCVSCHLFDYEAAGEEMTLFPNSE